MKVIVVGGGIGGLTTMLMLHAKGLPATLYEQARTIRELGVGINILPPATKQLDLLALMPKLEANGIRTAELLLANRFGQTIWQDRRGHEQGETPQISIHRGQLQTILYDAVKDRCGEAAVRTNRRLTHVAQDEDGVAAYFMTADGTRAPAEHGDVLVGADGVHSTVRAQLFGKNEPTNDQGVMWRGMREWPAFLTGRSMIVAGGLGARLIVYPVMSARDGRRLTNWVLMAAAGQARVREDWGRRAALSAIEPHLGKFSLPQLEVHGLATATNDIWEYPIRDRDPLPTWTTGRVTLLGDAAHPMYPVGSNGATQAVLDARALADALADNSDPTLALRGYDAERRPKTTEIVLTSRRGWLGGVINAVEKRAPDGFQDIDSVMSYDERKALVKPFAASPK